ncbi:MAG: hypothetical protein PF445_00705 [Melioribacteraceae bacterium]|jgi:2,5-diketo-D-gluconate reductase A|nr:hypothetical protein [Melioribacteraceae bacterium]
MIKKDKTDGINRREFLQTSSKFAAFAMLMSLETSKIFGAIHRNRIVNTIENITLNNGIKMPILGFGTLTLMVQ